MIKIPLFNVFFLILFCSSSLICSTLSERDQSLFLEINHYRTPFLDRSHQFLNYTQSGGGLIYLGLGVHGLIKGDRAEKNLAILGFTNLAYNTIVTEALKATFQRVRPKLALDPVYGSYEHSWVTKHLITSERHSFPSLSASSALGSVYLLDHYLKLKWYWKTMGYGWVVLLGYSRIYQGAHYPMDILGGFLLGYLNAKTILYLEEKGFFRKMKVGVYPIEGTEILVVNIGKKF